MYPAGAAFVLGTYPKSSFVGAFATLSSFMPPALQGQISIILIGGNLFFLFCFKIEEWENYALLKEGRKKMTNFPKINSFIAFIFATTIQPILTMPSWRM